MPQVSKLAVKGVSREEAKADAIAYRDKLKEQGYKAELWDGESVRWAGGKKVRPEKYRNPEWTVAITFDDIPKGELWMAQHPYHYCIRELTGDKNTLTQLTICVDFDYDMKGNLKWDGVNWRKKSNIKEAS